MLTDSMRVLAQTPVYQDTGHNVWWELLRSLGFATAFGIVGILLAIFAYKLFDWISPIDVEKELGENRNIAVAIFMTGFVLGICMIISRAIGS